MTVDGVDGGVTTPDSPDRRRRALLQTLGAALTGALAGCPGEENGTPDADTPVPSDRAPTATPTDAPSATATDAETETATATETDATDERTATATDGDRRPRPDAAWPLPRRSVTNGGHNETGVRLDAEPTESWRAVPPDSADDSYDPQYTQPVIADGRVYATDRLTTGPETDRSDRHFLHAFDATTGERVWETELTDEGEESIAVTDCAVGGDRVYVGVDDRLYAVDAAEGTTRWTRTLPEWIDTVHPTGDRVVVVTDRTVHALDASGERRWERAVGEGVDTRPALDDRYLYVGASKKTLAALDPASGEVAWSRTVTPPDGPDDAGWAVTGVVATGERVVVRRSGGILYAYDRAGELVWYDGVDAESIATDGRRLYVGQPERGVTALDAATGERAWAQTVLTGPTGPRDYVVSLAVGDDIIYGAVSGDWLFAVRPADGSVRWTIEANVERLALGPNALYGVKWFDGALRRWTADE